LAALVSILLSRPCATGLRRKRDVQRIRHGQVVDEAALAAQQRAVFDPEQAAADQLRMFRHRSGAVSNRLAQMVLPTSAEKRTLEFRTPSNC